MGIVSFHSYSSTHPEILRARAVTPFRDVTYGVQTLCFNEGDIIGVSFCPHAFTHRPWTVTSARHMLSRLIRQVSPARRKTQEAVITLNSPEHCGSTMCLAKPYQTSVNEFAIRTLGSFSSRF
ncbi:unnamed protein product [Mesocestoides corti]|uniref:Uncharacterized protein n=1 Tax=Mesocestoides corti TaxID=53468 RepID=A0A0R3U9U3_MESCO|nr:unnamed protein product [Mesocestoides corti]